MFSPRTWIAFVVLCALNFDVGAQTAPSDASIAVPSVEVRSGPSPMYYATSKLHQGERVRVLGEKDGGWLAIEPPQGSYSWIENRLLGKHTGYSAVVGVDAPVRAGSLITDKWPDVNSGLVKSGTQVVILGDARIADDGSKWWPIKPQKEYRYIPRDAVRMTPAVEAVTAEANKFNLATPAAAETLWLQAEHAREAGNTLEAQRLYELCLRQPGIDADFQMRCNNRLVSLRDGRQVSAHPGYQPGRPAESVTPAAYLPPASSGAGATPPAANAPSSSPGWLRRAGFFIDGKQAYALVNSQGQLVMYATANAGLNLEPFINRNVTLAGTITYHGQLKKDYILATQVYPLP